MIFQKKLQNKYINFNGTGVTNIALAFVLVGFSVQYQVCIVKIFLEETSGSNTIYIILKVKGPAKVSPDSMFRWHWDVNA